jgi:tetratricopeptide (TPR) repeat protein
LKSIQKLNQESALKIHKTGIFYIHIILFFVAFILFISSEEAISQNNDISKYEKSVQQNPQDSDAHKNLGIAYAKSGFLDKASDEFKKAMEIEYNKGYKKGNEEAIRKGGVRIYTRYVVLSIAFGLLVAAVIVAILGWSELDEKFQAVLKNKRVKNFVNSVGAKLNPELRKRAIEVAQTKEKLRDAIHRETDSNLVEAASAVLPRLDELTKQASLLLELQQNLVDYIKDIDPTKLEMVKSDCEEKLRNEGDEEAKSALEYQLKQINNKRTNFSKAKAKIRTCDAVLNGIVARIDATSLDLMSLPSLTIRKQEFFERISVELEEELNITRNAAETVMEESL